MKYLLILMLLLSGCAHKKVVVAKQSCKDLVVLGTTIAGYQECEKE